MKLKLWDWVIIGQIIGNVLGIFWGRSWDDIGSGLLVTGIIWIFGRGIIYWYGRSEFKQANQNLNAPPES